MYRGKEFNDRPFFSAGSAVKLPKKDEKKSVFASAFFATTGSTTGAGGLITGAAWNVYIYEKHISNKMNTKKWCGGSATGVW